MVEKEALKNTVSKIIAMGYGDTITHQELAVDLQVRHLSADYRFAISKLKRECLENGKMLESIMKVGYRITNPDDYTSQALRQYRQGARRLSTGQKILDYAPTEKMSPEGISQYRNIKDRSAALNAHLAGAIVELKLLKKQHPLQIKE